MLNILTAKGATDASTANAGVSRETPATGLIRVSLAKIMDNPYQPRTLYDAEHILNLALSIKRMKEELPATLGLQQIPMARVGVIQRDGRIILADRQAYATGMAVRLMSTKRDAMAQLMFGHSRLRAFMVLAEGLRSLRDGSAIGMSFAGVSELETRFGELLDADLDYGEMPLTLGFALDHAMWSHAITENSQRKNITAIDEAQSIQRAIDEFGLTAAEAGKPFGYARSTTANKLRLLQLPAETRAAIADGRLTERHGRELARLIDDPERLAQATQQALKKGWTVRQLADDVNWRESGMKAEQARNAEMAIARAILSAGWTLPGQAVPVPVERLTDRDAWQFHEFDATDKAHMALFAEGECGPHCPCLVIGYSNHRYESAVRLDPESAPHMCVACTDSVCRHNKLIDYKEANEDAEAKRLKEERAQQLADLNNESHRIWQTWLKEQDLHGLWNDIRFWREASKLGHRLHDLLTKCEDAHEACQEILRMMYKHTRRYRMELQGDAHHPDDVRGLIGALTGVHLED